MARSLTCTCGECKTCRHREYMRGWYARHHAPPQPQLCGMCGEIFTPPTNRQRKWCSKTCKQRALYWRKNPLLSRECGSCGADISDRRKGLKWCSDSCAQRGRKKANPEKVLRASLKRYGISPEEYNLLLAKQDGVCAICHTAEINGFGTRLAVDHCHETKKVRGILCGNCNRGLGFYGHEPERLRAAIAYLEVA